MNRSQRRKYLLLVCIAFALVAIYHIQKELWRPRLEKLIIYEDEDDLGERDPRVSCLFPMPHPFDPSILGYIDKASPISCFSRQPPLTYIDDEGYLKLNGSALSGAGYDVNGSNIDCWFNEIKRKFEDDFGVEMGPAQRLTSSPIRPKEDFVTVKCYGLAGIPIYHDFHAFAQRRPTVRLFNNDREVGVAVIGLDSMSRLNFMRQLPLTYRLIKKMGGQVMLGFNKVGENTFPNVIPMLTGVKPIWEFKQQFKGWPFIWYDFEESGAATMYAEDMPSINMFDYLAYGIKEQPTLHYMRPYWLAVEKSILFALSSVYCLGGRPKHRIHFDYIKSFFKTYNNSPSFLFSLYNEPTHDFVNTAGVIDNDLVDFLNKCYNEGLLNRTVLVVLGDHGNRIDTIRQTKIGQIEDRMPFVAIVLPKWMEKSYPLWWEGVTVNRQRLLSSFDLYGTFRDVLKTLEEGARGQKRRKWSLVPRPAHFVNNKPKGLSLLRAVPLDRDCDAASIPDNFCVCPNDQVDLPDGDARATLAAQTVINHFNGYVLRGLASCSNHTFVKTENAKLHRLKSGHQIVQIMLWTRPGNGLFEASVQIVDPQKAIVRDVIRINRYGNQAKCLPKSTLAKSSILRAACYCSSS